MRLAIPVLYLASVVRPRCRNEETVTLLTRETVEVRAVSGAEAPVALRYYGEHSGPIEYRAWDGRLLRPFELEFPFEAVGAADGLVRAADAQRLFDAWHAQALRIGHRVPDQPFWARGPSTAVQPLTGRRRYFKGPIHDERTLETRRWVNDDRAERVARVHEVIARQVAFVDGVLWRPSLGPVWGVRETYRPSEAGVNEPWVEVVARSELAEVPDIERASVFAPDRLEDAKAEARRRAAARRGPRLDERVAGRIDIVDPRLLAGEDLGRELVAAARGLIAHVESDITSMPTDAVRLYADLRDAIAAGERGLDGPGSLQFDSLLTTAIELNDRWSEHHHGKVVRGGNNPVTAFQMRLRAAQGVPLELADDPAVIVVDADALRQLGR